jgi:tRNA pseudouridine55 synthase/H/ACA ribonucleoprotein complex subunit 4
LLGTSVGHAGTLDPQVSGVLVVMLGPAVRLAPILLAHDKEYICLLRLHGDTPLEKISEVTCEFTGRIYQRPPRKSAVKRNLRIRTIKENEILEVNDRLVLFRVQCDAGTYIRSLCHHMGFALCVGGHMQELRRVRSGPYTERDAVSLHALADAVAMAREGDNSLLNKMIQPAETALTGVSKIIIRDSAVDAICHGASLAGVGVLEQDAYKNGDLVGVFTQIGELVCLAEALVDSTAFTPGSTGLVASPKAVMMQPGTYPRGWRKHG